MNKLTLAVGFSIGLATITAANAATTGFVTGPRAGGHCTTYNVGGVEFSFDQNTMNNQAGRMTALNNAALGGYMVKVLKISEMQHPFSNSDTVNCNPGTPTGEGDVLFPTPGYIEPVPVH